MTSENTLAPAAVDKQRDALRLFICWVALGAVILGCAQALDWDSDDASRALVSMAVTSAALTALAPMVRVPWSYAVGHLPEGVDLGTGPLVAARDSGQLMVLRRALPLRVLLRFRMDLATRARRVRHWAASVLSLLTIAAGGWAVLAVDGPVGVGASLACGATVVLALGDLRTGGLGWLVFRVPFLRASALPHVDPRDTDVRLAHAVALGRWDEVRAAVNGEDGHTVATVNRAASESAIAECRYAEAADLARQGMEAAEEPFARALSAHQLVRAVHYAHESASAPAVGGLDDAVAAMRAVPSLILSSDAASLVDIARRDSEQAVRRASKVTALTNGPIAAAHHCCTVARAYAAQNRPKDAAKALERARKYAPGLGRIGVVEELILNS